MNAAERLAARERWLSRHRLPLEVAYPAALALNDAVDLAVGNAELGHALKVAQMHPDDAGDGWVPACEFCGDVGCEFCEGPDPVTLAEQAAARAVRS